MGMLSKMGGGQGYLKAGFLGFAGSGKTFTAVKLALGMRDWLGLDGPVAMFDTEGGSEYVAQMIERGTGQELVGVRSRSFSDLCATGQECIDAGVSVLIVDSVTHVWRELCDSYLDQLNVALERRNRPKKIRLEFQDWNAIKGKWREWPDFYLNSKLHIIIAGRAGFDWDFEERTDSATGREYKELVKTGTKMKVENEFGFEPSLLVEMEKIQVRDDAGKLTKSFIRRATVLKDRFDAMDGDSAENPDFDFFMPHVQMLTPGAHAPVDVESQTDMGITEDGESDFYRERKLRVILAEKVQAALVERWPSQTKIDKQAKVAAIKQAFGTTSWTEVEGLESSALKRGLEEIEAMPAPEVG